MDEVQAEREDELTKKNCIVCGEIFNDYTKAGLKKTCSRACRYKLYKNNNPEWHYDRKIKMRINKFKTEGLNFTESEITEIKEKIKSMRCEICKKTVDDMHKLCIDHDHNNNKYRGVICHSCNIILGHLEMNYESTMFVFDYLKKHNSLVTP